MLRCAAEHTIGWAMGRDRLELLINDLNNRPSEFFIMLSHYLINYPLPRMAAAVLGASLVSWAMPAEAAPQLLFEKVEASGNIEDCALRAFSALDSVGMEGIALTTPTVSSSNGDVTVTVFCESFDHQLFDATVMVAGQDEGTMSNMGYIMGVVSAELRSGHVVAPPPSVAEPRPMSEAEFGQLLTALEESWPEYLSFLEQPIANNFFTAAQASQIVSSVRIGYEEVQVATMLYPQVVDKGNWYLVEQSITLSHSRQQLRQQIAALE